MPLFIKEIWHKFKEALRPDLKESVLLLLYIVTIIVGFIVFLLEAFFMDLSAALPQIYLVIGIGGFAALTFGLRASVVHTREEILIIAAWIIGVVEIIFSFYKT